ncbi:L,D-transpeptidase family protein [Flammeovirga sp. MY04]|uniref:L,D-transpeptidase n=1 Tax=Flammeovirga sp. MY04 TaxID=1191459 RepID=UPI000A00D64B|nr:L,D-transpeptidase [Flammeovirga sp. MY04]ANQ51182.2 L,D-transpeptidase family protein [Flammeovirga sp. MY04]
MYSLRSIKILTTLFLISNVVFANSERPSKVEIAKKVYSLDVVSKLKELEMYMPEELKGHTEHIINDVLSSYARLSEHQKDLLVQMKCSMRVLSKEQNTTDYELVHQKLSKALKYLRSKSTEEKQFAFVGNLSRSNVGGQKGYLVDMKTGTLVEVDISSAWKGIGFKNESEKSPLGYFEVVNHYDLEGWQAKTITSPFYKVFHKIKGQSYKGEVKYLYRKSTKIERAFITSNQFGLIGKNDGNEYIDLSARDYLRNHRENLNYIDNSNSSKRLIYIHGTNREDQLGYELSGGCIRVSNIFSFLFKEVLESQQSIDVFLDAAALYEPQPIDIPGFDPMDLESIYRIQTIQLNRWNLMDSMKLNKRLFQHILPKVSHQLADKMTKVKDSQVKVSITMTVPFPESAMKYWIPIMQNDLHESKAIFQNRFGLKGQYVNSLKESMHSSFYGAYSPEFLDIYFQSRMQEFRRVLTGTLAYSMKQKEMDTDSLENILEITEQEYTDHYFTEKTKSELFKFYSISDERKRVLHYMEVLDSVIVHHPEMIEELEHLSWMKEFVNQREHGIFENSDVPDYYDALLVQSYLYALGEEELYHIQLRLHENSSMNESKIEGDLLSKYGLSKTLNILDEQGLWYLFEFSRSSENYIKMGMESAHQPKRDMMRGILLLAESYYSQFKWQSNTYMITTEVDGDYAVLSD